MKAIFGICALLLGISFSVGCHRTQPPVGSGENWRSFTPQEKRLLVSAYISGSNQATISLCRDMESHLSVIKFDGDANRSQEPCRQFAPSYTHSNIVVGVDPYISTIDDFYRHPECRVMPYVVLLEHLNDAEYKSGEDLYVFARSGKAPWGFFSGFDGMDKCYGVDHKTQ